MEDDSTLDPFIQTPDPVIQMLLDDEQQEDGDADDAEDFNLILFLLQEENHFSEVDVLDDYGNPRQQQKIPRGKQRKRDPDKSRFKQYLDAGEEHSPEVCLILFGTRIHGKEIDFAIVLGCLLRCSTICATNMKAWKPEIRGMPLEEQH
jgi:hypothetical protein